VDAAFRLLINWATSIVSSVIATAVAALFRDEALQKLHFLAVRTLYRTIAFVRFLNCNSAVQQELKIVYRVHFVFLQWLIFWFELNLKEWLRLSIPVKDIEDCLSAKLLRNLCP